jgi:hypothetical protein
MYKVLVIGPTVLVGGFTISTIKASHQEDLNRCKDDIKKLSEIYTRHRTIANCSDNKPLIITKYHNLFASQVLYEQQSLEEWLNLPFYKRLVIPRPQIDIIKIEKHVVGVVYDNKLDRSLERY